MQARLSKTQQNKNYMAKLTISEKYEEHKKKKASVMKKCRQKKKMSNEQKETATVDIEENSRSILSSGYNSV